ncbi:unnamed protein product [Polarella glacialis]|uniref:oligopeptidase A n=1 Tax=Polarella glacialis TaxID=89957 RepID=A0A813EI24_POLGL|nr:unnamed protein product [Polarella glacialis]
MVSPSMQHAARLSRARNGQRAVAPVRRFVLAAAACTVPSMAFSFLRHRLHSPLQSAANGAASAVGHRMALRSASASAVVAENPLLDTSGLPHFTAIEPVHVQPGMTAVLSSLREGFQKFEAELPTRPASYESIVEPLEKLNFPLAYSWGIVSHLNGVKNSEALREVHQACQPEVVKASMELGQSRPVYDALARLDFDKLTEPQQRVVESSLRGMRLSGVDLEGEAKAQFNDIALKLSELGTQFQNNLLDATKAFELTLTDLADVAGLPQTALAAAAQSYNQALAKKGDEAKGVQEATPEAGPWRLTLDMPSYIPAMKHLKSSATREQLYRANVGRASTGKLDNGPLVAEILELRQTAAKMLGFGSFAEQSLASKMAPDAEAVSSLTKQLSDVARPAALRELAELKEFAASKGYEGELKLWDVTYWSERYKEAKYSYDEEALRPYFSLPKVLEGMFGIASKLFGIEIARDDAAADRWHPDVMFFKVTDSSTGEHIASFFLDAYARPGEKRGGAWMADCLGRSKALGTKPVAYLTCNGSPPLGEQPSLMTFSDAETLFHEFGHGLQHMLTHVEDGEASGINNIEWDAVELPSQFMENWLFHKPTVDSFAVHYETGEPLPADIFDKIKGARVFMAGSVMLRQLQFGALDMELHAGLTAGEAPFDVQKRIAKQYAVIPPLEEDRFLNSFAHIFAGGYAAGYYSYKWAEVLSADAFAAFEEAGLDDPAALAETGRRFRATVLGCGGSRHPANVYRDFRGKDATADAVLRHNGLT